MIVEFDKSFERSLDRIRDQSLFSRIEKSILNIEKADKIEDIPGIKKLSGYKSYYRIRIGDYRLGFEKIDPKKVRIIIIAHRKDIYKTFP
jgi:mRNA interferase RelE/StbE